MKLCCASKKNNYMMFGSCVCVMCDVYARTGHKLGHVRSKEGPKKKKHERFRNRPDDVVNWTANATAAAAARVCSPRITWDHTERLPHLREQQRPRCDHWHCLLKNRPLAEKKGTTYDMKQRAQSETSTPQKRAARSGGSPSIRNRNKTKRAL